MKQILQNLGSGETLLAEVPAPLARAGQLLIRTEASLVPLGTEKMLVAFAQANWLAGSGGRSFGLLTLASNQAGRKRK